MRLRQTILPLLVAAAASLAAGSHSAAANDKVTFVTDFGFNGRHAYYFLALDKGYYAQQHLDVDIVRGQGSADAVKQVAAGTAQLGFADAGAVILARANDHVPTKLVAMIYARPPHAIFVLKDSGITKPKDLEGKTLADTAFSAMPKLFDAYAEAAHIDASKVHWVIASSEALPGMLAMGRVDGIGQYTIGEALLAKAAAPKKILALPYAAVGLNFYSNGIIASDSMIKEHPDVVRRFVAATLEGLKEAIKNPQEAGEIMHKYHREVDTDIGISETKKVAELAKQPGVPLGYIEPARMAKTIDVISAAYKIKDKPAPSEIYAPGFVPGAR